MAITCLSIPLSHHMTPNFHEGALLHQKCRVSKLRLWHWVLPRHPICLLSVCFDDAMHERYELGPSCECRRMALLCLIDSCSPESESSSTHPVFRACIYSCFVCTSHLTVWFPANDQYREGPWLLLAKIPDRIGRIGIFSIRLSLFLMTGSVSVHYEGKPLP